MLPDDFRREMVEQLGKDEAEALFAALEDTPPVSVRINAAKNDGVTSLPVESSVPWCQTGYYLSSRPQFTLDPLFHAGCYYVQEASSMAIAEVWDMMKLEGAQKVLDLCAAPGGKSTLWASLLSAQQGSLLVSNEPIHSRAVVLAENMAKWGLTNTIVTQAYPKAFAPMEDLFDVVAADVPCSGEGMFRKDEGARAEWSLSNVEMCAERQWGIICDVWPALRPGGFLVYSTCTFNRSENEQNVSRICDILGAESLFTKHFYPHQSRGEGFFVALLKKNGNTRTNSEKPRTKSAKTARILPPWGDKREAKAWLTDASSFQFVSKGDAVFALRDELLACHAILGTCHIPVLLAGVKLAEQRGRKWIPAPELALSTALEREAFPHAELSLDSALAYLHREVLVLAPEVPRGFVVVTYQNQPLGFVNNLGTRANNLYPAEWRIRNL